MPPAITTANTADIAVTPIRINKAVQLIAIRTAINAPRTIMPRSNLGCETVPGIIGSSTSGSNFLTPFWHE
jgi:hypothetical protein